MCAYHQSNKKNYSAFYYLLSIAFGIFAGLSNIEILQGLGFLISDIFIKIFKCISLPIIALSIIVTLAGYSSEDSKQNIWQKTVFYTISTTIIAATISCVLYMLMQPENVNLSANGINNTQNGELKTSGNYFSHISNIIPSNIFSPFLDHQVMGVLLVGVTIGISIRYIQDEESHKSMLNFFKGTHNIFLVITSWVVSVIPVGLFGFITVTVTQLKEGIELQGLGKYLLIVVLANLIQGFIVLPTWLSINKIKPFATMKAMFPALSVAFFSKSSSGTLPLTISTTETRLNVNPKVSRFVLPLCTTVNMNGCAAFIFTTVIFIMQNNGIEINFGTMLLWIFISTIAAIGNAGVPMGCFFLSASLLASMNIPITLLGIILPFYSIIDMIETALNVWSDVCVTKVIDSKLKLKEVDEKLIID